MKLYIVGVMSCASSMTTRPKRGIVSRGGASPRAMPSKKASNSVD